MEGSVDFDAREVEFFVKNLVENKTLVFLLPA
jgi:hypothetical protein